MDIITKTNNALNEFEARVETQRKALESTLKAELVKYIIDRFREVSYAEQCISLHADMFRASFDKHGEYAASPTPTKHFRCMGMKKHRGLDGKVDGSRYYVEFKRRYYTGEPFGAIELTDNPDLTISELKEIATCLKNYGRPCFTTGEWIRDYDSIR